MVDQHLLGGLTVTVDATVALLQAVGVPRDLRVGEEVALALQRDAFRRRVGREQNADRIIGRRLLPLTLDPLALVTAENRPIPKTDQDRARALQTMIAYTGRYRVEDGKVTTKVEAAWNEAWVGGEQVRFIRFEGERLFIESPPMPHPNVDNKIVKVVVIWDREK